VAAQQADQKVTRGLVACCGVAIALVAGFMTWHGLVWADSVAELIPGSDMDWLFVPAAAMLSGLNLVTMYVFGRELKPTPAVETNPARLLAIEGWKKRKAA